MADMFSELEDETLIEVTLLKSFIDDRSTKALVIFTPHGDPCRVDAPEFPPAFVPAKWFSDLMPMSIFLDIPDDASSLSTVWDGFDLASAEFEGELQPGEGDQLAARWRANKRPVETTKQYVARCYAITPPHLLGFAIDAIDALEGGRFNKAARNRIATYCELISHYIGVRDSGAEATE